MIITIVMPSSILWIQAKHFNGHRSTGESGSEHYTSEAVLVGLFLKIMVAE